MATPGCRDRCSGSRRAGQGASAAAGSERRGKACVSSQVTHPVHGLRPEGPPRHPHVRGASLSGAAVAITFHQARPSRLDRRRPTWELAPMNPIIDVRKLALALPVLVPCAAVAEPARHQDILQLVDQRAAHFSATSKAIWDHAELGYHEEKSSALLQKDLTERASACRRRRRREDRLRGNLRQGKADHRDHGRVRRAARAIAGGYADRKPVVVDAAGHGCGHNLLGAGAALAAVAVKEYMQQNQSERHPPLLRHACRGGRRGKLYMMRAGLFQDVDVVLHWHPAIAMLSSMAACSPSHRAAYVPRRRRACCGRARAWPLCTGWCHADGQGH